MDKREEEYSESLVSRFLGSDTEAEDHSDKLSPEDQARLTISESVGTIGEALEADRWETVLDAFTALVGYHGKHARMFHGNMPSNWYVGLERVFNTFAAVEKDKQYTDGLHRNDRKALIKLGKFMSNEAVEEVQAIVREKASGDKPATQEEDTADEPTVALRDDGIDHERIFEMFRINFRKTASGAYEDVATVTPSSTESTAKKLALQGLVPTIESGREYAKSQKLTRLQDVLSQTDSHAAAMHLLLLYLESSLRRKSIESYNDLFAVAATFMHILFHNPALGFTSLNESLQEGAAQAARDGYTQLFEMVFIERYARVLAALCTILECNNEIIALGYFLLSALCSRDKAPGLLGVRASMAGCMLRDFCYANSIDSSMVLANTRERIRIPRFVITAEKDYSDLLRVPEHTSCRTLELILAAPESGMARFADKDIFAESLTGASAFLKSSTQQQSALLYASATGLATAYSEGPEFLQAACNALPDKSQLPASFLRLCIAFSYSPDTFVQALSSLSSDEHPVAPEAPHLSYLASRVRAVCGLTSFKAGLESDVPDLGLTVEILQPLANILVESSAKTAEYIGCPVPISSDEHPHQEILSRIVGMNAELIDAVYFVACILTLFPLKAGTTTPLQSLVAKRCLFSLQNGATLRSNSVKIVCGELFGALCSGELNVALRMAQHPIWREYSFDPQKLDTAIRCSYARFWATNHRDALAQISYRKLGDRCGIPESLAKKILATK